ncbi:MAG TPA: ABC transporter permease subunit [Rhizomicrobium sp.]|nr:ABC transporter permease subunit [Rhizomicrobium sp.]
MWRDWLLRAAQLIGSIVGAVVLASLLATLSHPAHSLWPFLTALCERIFAAVRGDFGLSSVTGVPAMASAIDMMSFTFQLLAGGAVIALLIGIPLGILLSASRALRAAAPLIQIIAATPVFVAALALIWIAVRVLHWSGISQASALSWVDLVRSDGWSAALQAFALPALTVGAAGAASVQLSIRRAAAVAWSAPYRSGLRMMGLGALDIDLHYALPEVLAALLRDLGEIALALISATAVAEWVFNRNGAAILFLKSAALGDWNVSAAALFLFVTIALIAGFVGGMASQLIVPEDRP